MKSGDHGNSHFAEENCPGAPAPGLFLSLSCRRWRWCHSSSDCDTVASARDHRFYLIQGHGMGASRTVARSLGRLLVLINDDIAAGKKKTEYRDNTPFWRSRLLSRSYDEIHFRNGYAARAPFMRVECLGIRKDGRKRFAIRLGKILETRNYRPE
jgi:hypothetical protein